MARPLIEVAKALVEYSGKIGGMDLAATGPFTQELKEAIEYEESRPAFAGLIEVDVRVESLKHQLRAMIPDVSGRVSSSMKLAIDQSLERFDFNREVQKRVDEAVADEVRHLVWEAWRKMRWSAEFKKLVEDKAGELVIAALDARMKTE